MKSTIQSDVIENKGPKEELGRQDLRKCQNPGSCKGNLPNAALLYIELLDFQIQRGARNPQFGGGSSRARDLSVAVREGCFDELFLVAVEGLCQGTC